MKKGFAQLLEELQYVSDKKAWNENFKELKQRTKNRRDYYIYKLFQYYGAEELKYSGITREDMENQTVEILRTVVDKWDESKMISPNPDKSTGAYISRYVYNELKKYIARKSGVKTYYTDWLVSFKVKGLDIWQSEEENLLNFIMEKEPNRRDPNALLCKLRNTFHNPHDENYKTKQYCSAVLITEYVARSLATTPYYAKWLLCMSQNDINPWTSPLNELLMFVKRKDPYRENPMSLINKIRDNIDEDSATETMELVKKKYLIPEIKPNVMKRAKKSNAVAPAYKIVPLPERRYSLKDIDVKAAKNYISEQANISPYYARWLLVLDSYGVTITSDANVLCGIILKEKSEKKNPALTVKKLNSKCSGKNIETIFESARKQMLIPA